MRDVNTLLDEIFNSLETLGANFAKANFSISSDGRPNKWIISLIKYNDLDEEDTEQESFDGTEQSVTLEGNMEAIGEHLLSSYPLNIVKWGHFSFNYYNRSITTSVEFEQTKTTKAAKPKKVRTNK
jgi:hypothetical protein